MVSHGLDSFAAADCQGQPRALNVKTAQRWAAGDVFQDLCTFFL